MSRRSRSLRSNPSRCDVGDALSRRDLLRLGLGGLATLYGGLAGRAARAQQASGFVPFVLHVHCDGGWDPTMVFDDKIGAGYGADEAGAAKGVGGAGIRYVDHPQRPAVRAFFAARGANAAIVNGISVGSMESRTALANTLGTVPPGKFRPVDWLSFLVATLNPVLDVPHAVIDAPFMPGDYASTAVRLSKRLIAEALAADAAAKPLGDDGERALAKFRLTAISAKLADATAAGSLDGDKLRALYYGYAREDAVKARVKEASDALGAQGAEDDFTRAGKLAVEFFASGASQGASIQCGRIGLWDTTVDHYAQGSAHFEALFTGLNTVLDHADKRGVGGRMLVIVSSERGRAPRLNARGGKGAWPYTSALLWGAGISGGVVAGATDPTLRGLPIDPIFGTPNTPNAVTLEMGHIMAAVYLKLGVALKTILPNHKPLTPILTTDA